MSTSEERLLILKMLEEGKISSDDAAKLLEALDGGSKQNQNTYDNSSKQQKQQPNFNEEINKMRDRLQDWKRDIKKNYQQKDFDVMVDEFSVKAEKIGKTFATATFGVLDKVIDTVGSFVDTNSFNIFGNFAVVEKTYEANAAENTNIYIEGINGQVTVKKHLDTKVIINTKVRSPQTDIDQIVLFETNNENISLKLNKVGNLSVQHEVLVPSSLFNKIKIETSNGRISIEDTVSKDLEVLTKNAPVDLMGISSDKVFVSTKNARVLVSYVIAQNVEISTTNSVIDAKNLKAVDFKATTTNGRILAENLQHNEGKSDINVVLKTSNSSIKINMNDMENKAYKVKARTSNGNVNLLVPELTYHNFNKQGYGVSFVEAESSTYNTNPLKVNIDVETANGEIEIVK